jgi:hypothetical protein
MPPIDARISIQTLQQADQAWQVLLDQDIWNCVEVLLNGQPLYLFSRGDEGEPRLIRHTTQTPTALCHAQQ